MSGEFQAYVNYLNTISPSIAFLSSAIITPFGILGCLASAIIFFRNKTLKKTNMGYLYGWLSLFNLFSLLTEYFMGGFFNFHPNLTPFTVVSNEICKLAFFFIRICPHMASWFQAYVTFDRFIQLKYPAKALIFKNKRTINIFILLMVLVICLINLGNFFYFIIETKRTISSTLQNRTITLNDSTVSFMNETIMINTTIVVSRTCAGTSQILFLTDIISAAMRTWLPFVCIITFNVMSIRLLIESGKRANLNQKQVSSDSRSRREKDFTRVVLKLSFIFFGMNFPLSMTWIILNCYRSYSPAPSAFVLACINITLRSSLALAYLYQSLTFYLNFTFNISFRTELLRMIGFRNKTSELTTTMHQQQQQNNSSNNGSSQNQTSRHHQTK